MSALTLRAAGAALLTALLPALAAAQTNLYSTGSAVTGVEVRQYGFDSKFPVDHVRQIAVPFAVAVPLGRRFSFDVGTWYASTSVKSSTGTTTFSSLTDTQLRLAYVLGNDALVASVVVNLPTGKETTTQSKFGVGAQASSNFLLFPVNTYGTAFSVTPGLAAATSLGDWNVGVSGSLRWSGEYKPFSDGNDPDFKYQPGVEGRIRLGVDRLVGKSRFALGGTFSTFANDQLTGSGSGGSATYSPGNRVLVDASFVAPTGNGTVSVYAWNYHRFRSSSSDGTIGGRENILAGGVAGAFPLSPKLSVEPMVEARLWSPESGKGTLVGAGTGLRIQLSPALAFVPSVRADVGSVRPGSAAASSSVFGWDASGMLRYTF
ncbi:MAG: hypothetical protein U0133_15075 [Gemmatimonadales bacterium]